MEADDSIEWSKYRDFLADNWRFIALIVLTMTLLGAAFSFVARPVYEVSMLLQVENPRSAADNLVGELNKVFDVKAASAPEMEVVRSRMVVAKAVDNSNFDIDVHPKRLPVIGHWLARNKRVLSEPGLWGRGGYAWGAERAEVSMFNVPADLEEKPFVLTALGAGSYRLMQMDSAIDFKGEIGKAVQAPIEGGIIELKVDQLAANAGAQFVLIRSPRMKTVERLRRDLVIEEKGKQSGVIGISLKSTDPKQASRVLNEIAVQYLHQNEARSAESAAKTLSFIDMQLPALKRTLEESEAKYNEARNRLGTVNLGEEAKGLLQLSVNSQQKMMELNQRRAELMTRYEPLHPLVAGIDQQIKTLAREQQGLNTRIKALPEVEQEVLRLSRDVKVNTDVYTAVLSTAQQLRLSSASKVGNVRLLDPPEIPAEPGFPKPAIIIPITAGIGLALGMFAAFFRKRAFGRVQHPQEVEEVLGFPVTAAIPRSDALSRQSARTGESAQPSAVLPYAVPDDPAVEGLQRFRSVVEFTMRNAANNIIVISGPTPGVGKSFVSVNFAAVLASGERRVLLIDGDLRTGALHRYFGLERGAGLAEAMTTGTDIDTVIRKGVARNVDFLSTGKLCANPTELVAHEPFRNLLQTLSARYDNIVIDTAPVLLASHTLDIARHAGATFNIVRRGVTTSGEIEAAVQEFSQVGVTVTGTVFNDWKMPASRYGYAYGYRAGDVAA